MDVLKAIDDKAFWGYDFLTWLWFRSEGEGGEFQCGSHGPASLWVEDHMVLESDVSDSKENILKSGEVSSSAEAAAALAVGKKVTRARFGMIRGEFQWSFLIDGRTFDITSMKIPKVESEEEEDDGAATALVRMGHVRVCLEIIDELFAQFTQLRVSGEWGKTTLDEMALWISEKKGG